MRTAYKRPLWAAVLAIAGALAGTASHAQQPQFPPTLPSNSVYGRLGAGQAGPAQAIPFSTLSTALGTSPACVTPFQFIPQAQWAAITAGTSSYDATANLQSALAAAAGSCLSFNPGTYQITAALHPQSNTVIYGNNAKLMAPAAGWNVNALGGIVNFGMITITQVSGVWIYDLHFYGTTTAADINHTPKEIQLDNTSNVHILHNYFEHTSCETIWSTANSESSIFVDGNFFTNTSLSCFAFSTGLPVVQYNWAGGEVNNNVFVNVGIAIGISTAGTAIGNSINGCTNVCISTGDGLSTAGAVIANNTIQITDTASNGCIYLGQGTNSQTETGNICIVTETNGNFVTAFRNQSTNSTVANETCVINSSSMVSNIVTCFNMLGSDSPATITGVYTNVNCFLTVTGSQRPICLDITPAANGRTVNTTVNGAQSFGAATNSGSAYISSVQSGGVANTAFIDVIKDGGTIEVDAPSSHSTEYNVATGVNNGTAFSYDNLTGTPQLTQILAGSGTTGAPGIAFDANTGTGLSLNSSVSGASIYSVNGNDVLGISSGGVEVAIGGVYDFSASGGPAGHGSDTGTSRIAAGIIGAGNGSPADVSGTFQATNFYGGTASASASTPQFTFTGHLTTGMYYNGGELAFSTGGVSQLGINTSGNANVQINGAIPLAWGNGAADAVASDTQVFRDAATGTLALARDATGDPAALRIYNITDHIGTAPTNYERGFLDWTTNTNAFTIGTVKGGTGTARDIRLSPASGALYLIGNAQESFVVQGGASGSGIGATDSGGNLKVQSGWNVNGLASGTVQVESGGFIGFANGTVANNSFDTAFSRSSAGLIQINNGTAGTYRDLTLRHISGQGTPTANSCTGFSAATGSSDTAGKISFSSATTCSITFAASYTNAPFCTITPGSAASTTQVATTTGGLTATFGTANTSFFYQCMGL